jgi:predicted TIM-barrel fold metal-dependent hydrolase
MPSEGWSKHAPSIPTVAGAVDYLKATGTDAALFNMWEGVLADTEEELEHANVTALELAARHAGFLYPGVCLHPAFPETSLRWLARFRELGYLWVGELVNYRKPYRYTDNAFLSLAAECAAHGHVLQLHGHDDIFDLAQRFPGLQVVCSHINVALCKRLATLPNTWVDISGSAGGLALGSIEGAFQAMGPDRLLYGTDFTGYEPRCFLLRLQLAVPAPADREKILSGNLLRLLKRTGSRSPAEGAVQDLSRT